MPRTFSLFHCSSPCGGGSLTPALPDGVRTFLNDSKRVIAIACKTAGSITQSQNDATCTNFEIFGAHQPIGFKGGKMEPKHSQLRIQARAIPLAAKRDYLARKALLLAALALGTYLALVPIIHRLAD